MEILVLHTGGTIACEQTNGSLAPSANITPILKEIAKEFKGLRFTQKRITPFLSECLNGNHLTKIATELQKALNKGSYVGAIVTHGSDTIAYTSAFLSYIFGASSLPIVTVCADLPLSDKNSSGHLNLRAATALILSNQACGVFSVYKDTDSSAIIHRGSRLLRHRAYESQLTSTAAHYGKAYLIAPENWK